MSLQDHCRVVVAGLALFAGACIDLRTTVPDVDGAPPEVELQVQGPGIGSQSLTNPPRETWEAVGGGQFLDLVPGATYSFALFVRDPGGVARATIAFPADLELSDLVGEGLLDEVSGLSRRLTVVGDRAAPYRVLALSGRLHIPAGAVQSFEIDCAGYDFGGRSGSPNPRFLYVSTAYGF